MLSTTFSRKFSCPPRVSTNLALTRNRSRIPFYKAEEATEAIRPKLGKLYHRDDRSFLGQLWSVFTTCKYVEKDPNEPGAMRWANLKDD